MEQAMQDNIQDNQGKNEAAQAMVRIRWSKTTPEQRKEHARMMQKKSVIARRKNSKHTKHRPFAKLAPSEREGN
jgi:hypothetical protein